MPNYTLQAGRLICRHGKPFATINHSLSAEPGSVSPVDLDTFARDVAAAMSSPDAKTERSFDVVLTGTIKLRGAV